MAKAIGGEKLRIADALGACLVRADGSLFTPEGMQESTFKCQGEMKIDVYRKGKLDSQYVFKNLVVNVGKNYILDVMFNSGTQIASSSWFMGLVSDSGFTSIQATDTASSHAGWTEFTGYSQSTRVLWGQGAASGQAVTNASPATFDITSTGTIRGGFIISNSTKGGTTGTLWAAALFTSSVPVNNGDQLRCTYTLST